MTWFGPARGSGLAPDNEVLAHLSLPPGTGDLRYRHLDRNLSGVMQDGTCFDVGKQVPQGEKADGFALASIPTCSQYFLEEGFKSSADDRLECARRLSNPSIVISRSLGPRLSVLPARFIHGISIVRGQRLPQ